MAYTVKSTAPAKVTTDTENDTMTIKQGFYVWVDGFEATTTGQQIEIVIEDASTKTLAQQEAEVNTAVGTFITENYPS